MNRFNINIDLVKQTPYYIYDLDLLQNSVRSVKSAASKYNFSVHYALKANSNTEILKPIFNEGLGADCVSGNEVLKAIEMGVDPNNIVLAGVGKTDIEIQCALEHNIHSLNVESIMELEVIQNLALEMDVLAKVALRINPNINANTHKHITTGLKKNKFGIAIDDLDRAVDLIERSSHIRLEGLHFHIGSQIMELKPYIDLCKMANRLVSQLEKRGVKLGHLNLGGGLGVNYCNPDVEPIPNFDLFFKTMSDNLDVNMPIHFELGRSIVAQCGALVTKVLYEKKAAEVDYLIVDAGMTELMRPALYGAQHKIESCHTSDNFKSYSVVGPVCESTDSFGHDIKLPKSGRGDILMLRTAGAYGECMANHYNLRQLEKSVYFSHTKLSGVSS